MRKTGTIQHKIGNLKDGNKIYNGFNFILHQRTHKWNKQMEPFIIVYEICLQRR